MQAVITHATRADCAAIAELSARTFSETFGHLYKPEDLASHLASHSSVAFFEQALARGDTLVMLKVEDKLVGYSKLGHVDVPVDTPPKGSVEIHRVYLDKAYQNRGLGKAMMKHILALPQVATAPAIYIGVWEENLRAQALYHHYGFKPIGHYLYYVGAHADREIIMARTRAA